MQEHKIKLRRLSQVVLLRIASVVICCFVAIFCNFCSLVILLVGHVIGVQAKCLGQDLVGCAHRVAHSENVD